MFDTFSKNLPANFKIFLSNFENCKFCQRVGLAPLDLRVLAREGSELDRRRRVMASSCVVFQMDELPALVRDLSQGRTSWDEALSKYPAFVQQEASK